MSVLKFTSTALVAALISSQTLALTITNRDTTAHALTIDKGGSQS